MKKRRKNKGITLIALIITIIVLLILAGVTISFVVGGNGILTQAQKAKIRTDKESAEEEVKIEVAGSYDDEGNLNLDLLNANLENNLDGIKLKVKKDTDGEDEEKYEYLELGKDLGDGKKIEIESLPATVYYKQNEVIINGKGKLLSDVASNPENYGMYVDYPIDLDGDKETSDWKIFYEDETGRVFLIAADYVPNSNEKLKIAQGISGSATTDTEKAKMTPSTNSNCSKCCSSWTSTSVPDYGCNDGYNTSLNSEKEQCSFPEIFMLAGNNNTDEHTKNHYYCSKHTINTNSKCASALQCTGNWSSFVDSKYGEYAIGGPTLEMWVASWNQKHGEVKDDEGNTVGDGITLFANGNGNSNSKRGYCVGTKSDCTDYYKSITNCVTGWSDKLYFPHKGEYEGLNLFEENESSENDSKSENASCEGYWLASPVTYVDDSCLMCVNYRGKLANYGYNYTYIGVRPVVSLQSGVYVEVQEETTDKDGKLIKSCRLVK